jgi:DUF4097 and DUF4098 domain-containing protein YvlB
VRLIAQFNDNKYNNAVINLWIRMPSTLALLIDDRCGGILIEAISNGLTLNDRSGDIDLSHIVGLVRIEDRFGDVVIEDLRGDDYIDDLSGEINLKGVVGVVNIVNSSSDIYAKNMSGNIQY